MRQLGRIEYINRDAVLDEMWRALWDLEDKYEREVGLDPIQRNDIQNGFEAGQQVVANAPEEDVAPQKHGYWFTYDDVWYICSECGYTTKENFPIGGGILVPPHYCCSCGSDNAVHGRPMVVKLKDNEVSDGGCSS